MTKKGLDEKLDTDYSIETGQMQKKNANYFRNRAEMCGKCAMGEED